VQASYVAAAYPAASDYQQQAAAQQAWVQPVQYAYVDAGPQWQRTAGIPAPPSVNPPTVAASEKADRRTRVSAAEPSETSGAAVIADSAAPSRPRRKGLRSVASSADR